MPRQRNTLPNDRLNELNTRIARHESPDDILSAMPDLPRLGYSRRTIVRRIRERKGRTDKFPPLVSKTEPKTESTSKLLADLNAQIASLPDEPDAIPDDTPLAVAKHWLAALNKLKADAQRTNDLRAVIQLSAKALPWLQYIDKHTPIEAPDRDESEDMIALAAKGEEMLLRLVNDLRAEQSSA